MVSDEAARAVVERLAEMLDKQYVFPEIGAQMAERLLEKLQQGAYEAMPAPETLARILTEDVRAVAEDLHLQIDYDPVGAAKLEQMSVDNPPQEADTEDDASLQETWLYYENYGFERVERLSGNIGYLDLRTFAPTQIAGDVAVAALNFLARCKALIIDLRQNGGGDATMIQLITSYLFGGEVKLLNSFYSRPTDEYTQLWTLPYIPGKDFRKTPVYVLISGNTFSAAEGFSDSLKHMKRATLVGEYTGGAAHPVDMFSICEGFTVQMPEGRAINPITNTNWEGTGVEPDIAVPAERALETAHLHALETLAAKATTDFERGFYAWEADATRARYQPASSENCAHLAGTYGHMIFFEEGGHLYRQAGRVRIKLTPLGGNRYGQGNVNKLTFEVDDAGHVTAVSVLNRQSGQTKHLDRSS